MGTLISIIHAIAAMERGVIPPLKGFIEPHPDARSLIDGRLNVSLHSSRPVQRTLCNAEVSILHADFFL